MDCLVFYGLFGAVAAELLPWYARRFKVDLPAHAKSLSYWVPVVLMVVSGGVLTNAYLDTAGVSLNPILAINVGASAPLALRGLAGVLPELPLKTD